MLQVTIYYDSSVCDLDNSLKTLLDCLQYAHAINDDNLCYQILATKRIDKTHPRVEFALKEINEHLKLF
jgi:Holliday junction resolvase RusA-like endonuclease